MTFRAKPVVKRAHRPAWEAQDRRNFYLNLGFGLIVLLAPSSSWHRRGLSTTTITSRSVASVDGQSITNRRPQGAGHDRELPADESTRRIDTAVLPDT